MNAIAAVPDYVGADFNEAAPGHRFGLYLPYWRQGDWSKAGDSAKLSALKSVLSVPKAAQELLQGLMLRQYAQAQTLNESVYSVAARSTSPFLTGIGMEHPVENGFAFLNPYGLPYLPGASVKGLVRTVVERMALGLLPESQGWDPLAVWWVFGFEAGSAYLARLDESAPDILVGEQRELWRRYAAWVESGMWDPAEVAYLAQALFGSKGEKKTRQDPAAFLRFLGGERAPDGWDMDRNQAHLKGALAFWDIYIQPSGDSLGIDILTPHYAHYYQESKPPHDAGQPTPNPFLVVPPGSGFVFHVALQDSGHFVERLAGSWRNLMQAAMNEAFQWFGFGAKTAVGYGQMESDQELLKALDVRKKESVKDQRAASLSPEEQMIENLCDLLEKDRSANHKEPAGELASQRIDLLRAAKEWKDLRHRKMAAEIIRETVRFLPWAKKRKQEANEILRILREN